MTWDVQVLPRAEKALKKLDKPQASRIRDALARWPASTIPVERAKHLAAR